MSQFIEVDVGRLKMSCVTLQDNASLELPVASCLVTKAEIDGKPVVRAYTPTSDDNTRGHFDLIVKRCVV
jgi:hypothetical protein